MVGIHQYFFVHRSSLEDGCVCWLLMEVVLPTSSLLLQFEILDHTSSGIHNPTIWHGLIAPAAMWRTDVECLFAIVVPTRRHLSVILFYWCLHTLCSNDCGNLIVTLYMMASATPIALSLGATYSDGGHDNATYFDTFYLICLLLLREVFWD